MKLNACIVCALAPLTAVMVMAQNTAPTPSAAPAAPPPAPAASAPAPASPAPAPETAPARPKPKAPTVKKRVELNPPTTAVVKSANVNVRGQASFIGETLGHLQKGDTVAVSEEITLGRHAADEPAQWARIAMPAGIPVWVDGVYVDPGAKTIKVRRVNLRGGPGENFSVVGYLEKGAAIKEIKTDKGWISIEAPTNAYAFVAAEFLDIQPPSAVVVASPPVPAPVPAPQVVNVITPPVPAPATNEIAVAPPPAPAPVPTPPTPKPVETNQQIAAASNAPPPSVEVAPSASSEPVIPRIVTREGFVRRAYNVQAPADFELHDIQTGVLIDYLQPKPGQNFKVFVGTRVTVTGPEGLDPRWHRTPVLQVQSVDLMP
jgi:hypothetical protein